MGSGRLAVQVVKATAQALVEDSRIAKSQRAVTAYREATCVDSTGLARSWVELELVVRHNVCDAAILVGEHSVLEGNNEGTIGGWAFTALSDVSTIIKADGLVNILWQYHALR